MFLKLGHCVLIKRQFIADCAPIQVTDKILNVTIYFLLSYAHKCTQCFVYSLYNFCPLVQRNLIYSSLWISCIRWSSSWPSLKLYPDNIGKLKLEVRTVYCYCSVTLLFNLILLDWTMWRQILFLWMCLIFQITCANIFNSASYSLLFALYYLSSVISHQNFAIFFCWFECIP